MSSCFRPLRHMTACPDSSYVSCIATLTTFASFKSKFAIVTIGTDEIMRFHVKLATLEFHIRKRNNCLEGNIFSGVNSQGLSYRWFVLLYSAGSTLCTLFSQLFRVRVVYSRWTFYKKCFFVGARKKMLYIQNLWTIPLKMKDLVMVCCSFYYTPCTLLPITNDSLC